MKTIRLYSFAAPLALLPILDFSFSAIGPYLKGTEFRTLIAEVFTQALSGVGNAFLTALFSGIFG